MLDVGAIFAILVLPLLLLVLFHVLAAKAAAKAAKPPSSPTPRTPMPVLYQYAQHAFSSEAQDELALVVAERVEVLRQDSTGWTLVRSATKEGWVPASFLANEAPERYFSVDVECAATGLTHDDRAPCRVALVREDGSTVLDLVIRVDGLVSPLTPLTGLTAQEIALGCSLQEARDRVRAELGECVVLVGQSIGHDIKWLGLREGVDFKKSIDLADLFKCSVKGASKVLSLEHEALGLLNEQVQVGVHSPVEDAQVSLRLYSEWGSKPERVHAARQRLSALVASRALPPRHRPPPKVDGVCMGRWSCSCTCR